MLARRAFVLAAFAAVGSCALTLTGCGGDSNGTNPVTSQPAANTSHARAFNAVRGLPSGTTASFATSNFASGTIGYGTKPAYSAVTSAINAPVTASVGGQGLPGPAVTYTPGSYYTVVFAGDASQTSGAYAPQLFFILDHTPANLPQDKFAFRTLNLSPNPSLASINVTGVSPSVQQGAEVVVGANIVYGYNGTATQPNINDDKYFIQPLGAIPAADTLQSLSATFTFTIRDPAHNTLLTLPNVTLTGNSAYTLFFYGNGTAGDPYQAQVVQDSF